MVIGVKLNISGANIYQLGNKYIECCMIKVTVAILLIKDPPFWQ